MPHPEPESKPLAETPPKRTVEQDNGDKKGAKNSRNGVGEPREKPNDTKIPSLSPKAEGNHSGSGNNRASKAAAKKDETEMVAITIAGHNLGAVMDAGSSYSRRTKKHLFHDTKDDKSHEEHVLVDAEGSTTEEKSMITLVNSNVQTVNNALLFNSTCTVGSPGVHISLTSRRRRQPKKKSH
ncbi:hypothetical protein B296_00018155 [Ensete ventricosum]|uniref:Uncharacterized protein n=1 Tax=Ensete ventricosum TaxID=4639 RepID=A0A426ZZU6_ENSVE|nr:hypothetical protein B296_00018155 [Ensete ventricosum]